MSKSIGNLIAPCGMNCGIYKFYLSEDHYCPGCRMQPKEQCRKCKIRACEKRTGDFCFSCK